MNILNSPAVEVLVGLQRRGFRFRSQGGKLLVSPFSQLSEDDLKAIAANRAALIDMVRDDRPLETAIRKLANELVDDVVTLADFSQNLCHELHRGQQLQLLHRLAAIGRRIHQTTSRLCRDSDANREIPR
jgi:hypothetical protein